MTELTDTVKNTAKRPPKPLLTYDREAYEAFLAAEEKSPRTIEKYLRDAEEFLDYVESLYFSGEKRKRSRPPGVRACGKDREQSGKIAAPGLTGTPESEE